MHATNTTTKYNFIRLSLYNSIQVTTKDNHVSSYEYEWWDYIQMFHSNMYWKQNLQYSNTTTNYKILWSFFELHWSNCKGNHISFYINIDYGNIFLYPILKCIGNTIYSLVIFLRVVPMSATNNTTSKYKIVWLPLKSNPGNCKGNHISSYINMDGGTIIQNFNPRCNGNTIHSLVTFSRVVPIHAINTTTKYDLVRLS